MYQDRATNGRTLRCAIYTRKSSERGLQQDFNSLKAQQAICSAYIQSQQHKGWTEIDRVYEDAAQSGATLDRPAMKELLADVEKGRIDVIVVYKLDRLSRSLLDFVRLLDSFERYGVTFACITQNFDTGDSLGRLVMNTPSKKRDASAGRTHPDASLTLQLRSSGSTCLIPEIS